MFFKDILKFIFIILVAINFVNCSLDTDEEAYKPEVIKIDEFSCIDNVGDKFSRYFAGTLSKRELEVFFDCAKDAMGMFKNNTRSATGSSYSSKVLQKFLHKYYLRKNKISDELLQEAMKIKVSMVGGSSDYLTKKEISRGIELLEIIKNQAMLALPYMKIYNRSLFDNDDRFTPEFVEELQLGFDQLQEVASSFAYELGKNKSNYNIKSFKIFLVEFKKFLNVENADVKNEAYYKLESWVDLGVALKKLLFRTSEEYIAPDEWNLFLKQGLAWYSIYLRYNYTIKGVDGFVNPGLSYIKQFGDEIYRRARSIVSNHIDSMVDFESVNQMLYALDQLELIPFGIPAKTLEDVIPKYIKRGFVQRGIPYKKRKVTGVNLEAVENVYSEFKIWHWAQEQLVNHRLNNRDGVSYKLWENYHDISKCYQSKKLDFELTLDCELGRILNERPMFIPDFNTVYLEHIDENKYLSGEYQSFKNLSYLNVVRATTRLLIRTYGYSSQEEIERAEHQLGIKEREMQAFYDETQNLGSDLGFMDPPGLIRKGSNQSGGERSFMWGKLFTYATQGYKPEDKEDLLTYSEATQLISLLYSGGTIGKKIYLALTDEETGVCENTGELDVLGEQTIYYKCFRLNLRKYLLNLNITNSSVKLNGLESMPGMKDYLTRLSIEDFEDVMDLFDKIVFEKKKYVSLSNLTYFMTVMHYVEATMTRYDKDSSGLIDFDEAMEATNTFKDISFGDREFNEADMRAILIYTMNGAPPGLLGIIGIKGIPFFMKGLAEKIEKREDIPKKYLEMKLDRGDLIRVFSDIISRI